MRVGLGGLVHETNTYALDTFGPTGLGSFHRLWGDRLIERSRGVRTCLGGFLDALDELGGEAVPLWWAAAEPSGTIELSAYEAMRDELLEAIAAAMPLDALALDLHGAGVVDGVEDLEGDLGRAVRELVGPDLPIVVSLDLHGNVTDAMAEHFDVMLGYHLYPHTDMWERGHEAVHLLPALLDGSLRPVTHVEHLPVLLPTSTTDPGFPAHAMNDVCRRLEEHPDVVDCTVFHGFPFTDVVDVGVHVVVVTNGDADLARSVGAEIGGWIWEHREEFRSEHPTPEQAIRIALAGGERPIVINDTSDNPGGGTPGDGTHLLRALLDAGVTESCFGGIYDPEVVEQAHAAGVGASIEVRLGGKHDALHGEPLVLRAYVKGLTDGRFTLRFLAAGATAHLGKTARLVVDGLEIVVISVRQQTSDPAVFTSHGIDLERCRIIALKSSNHFRAGFAPLAAQIVTADAPGLTTTRVEVFHHTRATRPLWPTDPDAAYVPGAPIPRS